MNLRRSGYAISGVFFGLALTTAVTASANYRRVGAQACTPYVGATYAVPSFADGKYVNNDTSHGASFQCTIPDDTTIPKQSAVSFFVDVNNAHAGSAILAETCVQDFTGADAACNAFAETTAAGWSSLSPAKSYWSSPSYASYYSWAVVDLAAATAGVGGGALVGWLEGD
jgi:hypothetical protein